MTLRILLADDDITTQSVGMKILAAAGHDVVTVSNGVAALKRIADVHPDVVLLDVYLPGYSGIEVCEKVKATPEMAHISVLLTVSKLEPFPAEEGIRLKADGLIIKPFEAGQLIPVLEKVAERLRPQEAAMPPCVVVRKLGNSACQPLPHSITTEFQTYDEVFEPTEAGVEQTRPEPHVFKLGARSQVAADRSDSVNESDSSVPAETFPSAFSGQQGEEICDVCGYVNPEHAFVCLQCDVPLPSVILLGRGQPPRTL